MNTSRLKTLRRALLEHKDNGIRFDMGHWWDKYACDRGEDGTTHWCGTSACAWGLASTIKEFQKAGVHRLGGGVYYTFVDYSKVDFDKYQQDGVRESVGGYPGAALFFDITENEAVFLFSPDRYKREKTKATTVARRITRFIETKGRSAVDAPRL